MVSLWVRTAVVGRGLARPHLLLYSRTLTGTCFPCLHWLQGSASPGLASAVALWSQSVFKQKTGRVHKCHPSQHSDLRQVHIKACPCQLWCVAFSRIAIIISFKSTSYRLLRGGGARVNGNSVHSAWFCCELKSAPRKWASLLVFKNTGLWTTKKDNSVFLPVS